MLILLCTLTPYAHISHAFAENEDASRYPHLQVPVAKNQTRPLTVRPSRNTNNPQRQNSSRSPDAYSQQKVQLSSGARVQPIIKPKINPSHFVSVIGDTFGGLIAQGIDEAYGERTDVLISRVFKPDSGLVRVDFFDWTKAIQEITTATPKPQYIVVMLGVNDRQQLRDGDLMVEALTDRWKELYKERVRLLVKSIQDQKIAVVWVGLPPMKNEKLSGDLAVLNSLFKEGAQSGGGVFVDLWQPFADPENDNAFIPQGPDLTGKAVRLRTTDGIYFTELGARKAAHFIDIELKQLIEKRIQNGIKNDTNANAINANTPSLKDAVTLTTPAALPLIEAELPEKSKRFKPTIGQTFSLTTNENNDGASLVPVIVTTQRPALGGGYSAQSITPVDGRADDFRTQKQGFNRP